MGDFHLLFFASFLAHSVWGQFRKSALVTARSALPPWADLVSLAVHVSNVPTTDSCNAAFSTRFAAML